MAESSGNNLQFSINEAVWLQNGYEAEEIMSVALEPDIIIEESNQYVSIKGSLRLNGEYKASEDVLEENENRDFDDLSYRTMDEVTETDVGTALFEHRFPVDITIPSDRIHQIEDVFVTVESFDYSMADGGCLQIDADVAISGLQNHEPAPAAVSEDYGFDSDSDYDRDANYESDDDDSEQEDSQHEDSQQEIAFDAYREYEDYEENEPDGPQIELNRRFDYDPEFDDEHFNDRDTQEESYNNDVSPVDHEDDGYFGEIQHPFLQEEVEAVPVSDQAYETMEHEEDDYEYEYEYDRDEEEVSQSSADQNALYLTKVLANDDASDQFSKVKMCIVQNGESLDTISERYKVPITAILRKNQLESDVLDEGQVLYIPVHSTV